MTQNKKKEAYLKCITNVYLFTAYFGKIKQNYNI